MGSRKGFLASSIMQWGNGANPGNAFSTLCSSSASPTPLGDHSLQKSELKLRGLGWM